MIAVWKFSLELVDVQDYQMPAGAKILCLDLQHGLPCMWVEVDTDAPLVKRRFHTFGTGHEIASGVSTSELRYVGTYQTNEGMFVWHVYEEEG